MEEAREVIFEDNTWTKEIRSGVNSGLEDFYSTERDNAIWEISNAELVSSEINTADRYVGYSHNFTATEVSYNFTIDVKAVGDTSTALDVRAVIISENNNVWSFIEIRL